MESFFISFLTKYKRVAPNDIVLVLFSKIRCPCGSPNMDQLLSLKWTSGSRCSKKKCRKEQSEILTSSPYKKLFLQESPKTNTKVKKSKNTKIIKEKVVKKCKKPKMNSTTSTSILNESSWLCFMCGECNIENMICCRSCKRWAHEECAGTSDCDFICELCK